MSGIPDQAMQIPRSQQWQDDHSCAVIDHMTY